MYIKVEKQVCSLPLSKTLRDLGIAQESLWYWIKPYFPPPWTGEGLVPWELITSSDEENIRGWKNKHNDSIVSAYTVAELGEMLPNCVYSYKASDSLWDCDYKTHSVKNAGETEANARAKMLIYLFENKLMRV